MACCPLEMLNYIGVLVVSLVLVFLIAESMR